jgi:hypothetical protein
MSAALVALALLLPSAALAQTPETNAPPGNSGIDEYLETVPNPTGDAPAPPADGGGGVPLPSRAREELEDLGADGKAVAALAEQTGGPRREVAGERARGDRARGDRAHGVPVVPGSETRGDSPVGAALSAAFGPDDGGGGLGILLPVILVVTLLGVIALAVLRRRPTAT